MAAAWAGGAGGGRGRSRLTGMSGCIATSGVAIEKSEAPAEMPSPMPSVAYTFLICPTAPASRLSHVDPCSRRSRSRESTYGGTAELLGIHCCCCCCCSWPRCWYCCRITDCCADSGSRSITGRFFFTLVNRDGCGACARTCIQSGGRKVGSREARASHTLAKPRIGIRVAYPRGPHWQSGLATLSVERRA